MSNFDINAIAIQAKARLGDEALKIICQDLNLQIKNPKDPFVLCMMHNETTPSCHWRPEGSLFFCQGCNETYDIFDHYQRFDSLSFPGALKKVCEQVNMPIDDISIGYVKDPNLMQIKRKLKMGDYENKAQYVKNSEQSYLDSRGISYDVAKAYGVQADSNEIFFRSCEWLNGKWTEFFSKKRLLSGAMYEGTNERPPAKELSVYGAEHKPLFGIHTIFTRNKPKYVFITEGQLDCLLLATYLRTLPNWQEYAVVSVANGSQSLKRSLEDSPSFVRYMKSKDCLKVILVPDFDDAGKSMIGFPVPGKDGKKEKKSVGANLFMDDEKTFFLDIWSFPGMTSQILDSKGKAPIKDISEVLIAGMLKAVDLFRYIEYLPMPDCLSSTNVEVETIEPGIMTYFATWDHNDSGLKWGKSTIVYGARGEGKTTLAEQTLISASLQGYKSMFYAGESSVSEEKSKLTMMTCKPEYIMKRDNGAGRDIYYPNAAALDSFDTQYGRRIVFYAPNRGKADLFDDLLVKMEKQARRGVKLFVIDNMMMLTASRTKGTQNEKETHIAKSIVEFNVRFKTHTILICHTNKSGDQIAGAQTVENLFHTVIRFVRLKKNPNIKKGDIKIGKETDLSSSDSDLITATAIFEKVKDGGKDNNIVFEFIEAKGISREITFKEEIKSTAAKYQEKNLWSRVGQSKRSETTDKALEDMTDKEKRAKVAADTKRLLEEKRIANAKDI